MKLNLTYYIIIFYIKCVDNFYFVHFAGTLAQLSNYDQFAGTVYVRKAVNDHMVLTFCSPNTQLYSLVVFREKMLDPKELRSITNQMQRLKFPITQTKRTCRNTSSITQATVWLITVLGFAHVFFHVTK